MEGKDVESGKYFEDIIFFFTVEWLPEQSFRKHQSLHSSWKPEAVYHGS